MQKLLTVKEAATEMRLSAGTVYKLCESKKLRHQRCGENQGKILIPLDAIEEYLGKTTVGVEEATPTRKKQPQVKLENLKLS